MLIFRRFGKNWHFQSDNKKTKFSSKFLNIRRYRQKLFVQSDQNKTFFSRCNFPRNVNKYFRRYGQKTTFSKLSEKTTFSSICWYLQRHVLSKWSQENVLFLEKLIFRRKNRNFPRNVYIFADVVKKDFCKVISFRRYSIFATN